MATTAPGRPLTTQEHVLAELRRRILTGEVRPGDAIRAERVGAALSVSRVPVREALKILEGEGQVVYRPHHGYTLAQLDLDDLREIYRIRRLLEDEAARVALPRLTEEDLDAMRGAMSQMESLDDDVAAMAVANRRFHLRLLEASAMPHLLHHVRLLWNASDHYRSAYYLHDAHRREVHADHRRIASACEARDEDALIAALDDHRERAIEGLRSTHEEDRP